MLPQRSYFSIWLLHSYLSCHQTVRYLHDMSTFLPLYYHNIFISPCFHNVLISPCYHDLLSLHITNNCHISPCYNNISHLSIWSWFLICPCFHKIIISPCYHNYGILIYPFIGQHSHVSILSKISNIPVLLYISHSSILPRHNCPCNILTTLHPQEYILCPYNTFQILIAHTTFSK